MSVTVVLCAAAIGVGPDLFSHPDHTVGSAQVAYGEPAADVSRAPNFQGVATLAVTIVDDRLDAPTPVRVRITDAEGRPFGMPQPRNSVAATAARLAVPGTVAGLPAEAIGVMYGANDSAQGYAFQTDGAFYVKGSFSLPMPAGKFHLTISKGYEFVRETHEIVVRPGDNLTRTYRLRRWVDMPARGWYSADDHIHLRRSPRENPLILDWIAAEDVHVGVLLQMGDFWTTYFSQYAWGEKGRYGRGRYVLTSGQEEPRTHEIGHTISLGAENFVRFNDDYYSYDRVFDRVHELGGVTGYAHSAMSFHGYRGMTLDVLAGKIDFLEVMQFCVPQGPLALEHYYRFLDLGYKLTALGGSDFPWCGRGLRPGEEQVGPQIGDARFYTYTGKPFTFQGWLDGVKAGRTFVTTGPMLDLRVNGELPGASLDVKRGSTVRVTATAQGHAADIPLQRLQIIGHGKILAEAVAGGSGQTAAQLSVDFKLPVEHGIWLAARADTGTAQMAHTTPIYVQVEGDGFHNRSNLAAQIDASKKYLAEIRALLEADAAGSATGVWRSTPSPRLYPSARAKLERRIAAAEEILAALRRRP